MAGETNKAKCSLEHSRKSNRALLAPRFRYRIKDFPHRTMDPSPSNPAPEKRKRGRPKGSKNKPDAGKNGRPVGRPRKTAGSTSGNVIGEFRYSECSGRTPISRYGDAYADAWLVDASAAAADTSTAAASRSDATQGRPADRNADRNGRARTDPSTADQPGT